MNIIENLKKEAESELKAATPALEAANKAVDALSKDDIVELKGVKNPNAATEIALKCVLIYLGY
jgi:dynein heavy chain